MRNPETFEPLQILKFLVANNNLKLPTPKGYKTAKSSLLKVVHPNKSDIWNKRNLKLNEDLKSMSRNLLDLKVETLALW